MKSIPRAIIYNLIAISMFFIIYLLIRDHFTKDSNDPASILDVLNLSITMQTSVGSPYIVPKTSIAKFIITMQQFLLIFGNLFILHI
uniref:Potassium channel domain-containing protein n=1 Tax=viral metagenome TaxID=1070528 RepID=A0A6C0HRC4_9ZZZZ